MPVSLVKHDRYPHTHGRLSECEPCETMCYCSSLTGEWCLACKIEAQWDAQYEQEEAAERAAERMREDRLSVEYGDWTDDYVDTGEW